MCVLVCSIAFISKAYGNEHNKPLSKLAHDNKLQRRMERKARSYSRLNEGLSTVPTQQIVSGVELRKRPNVYLAAGGSYPAQITLQDSQTNRQLGFNCKIGYKFYKPFLLEVEGVRFVTPFRSFNNTSEVVSYGGLVNLAYATNFGTNRNWEGLIGLGAGYINNATTHLKSPSGKPLIGPSTAVSRWGFAYQAFAELGVGTQNLGVFINIKWLNLGKASTKIFNYPTNNMSLTGCFIGVGIKFKY